jgi:hypothetical protein
MPLEFGVFLGAKRFGGKKQKNKSFIIYQYRYMEFISDISGQDIKAHDNLPDRIIREIRNWLNTFDELGRLTGATAIICKYEEYLRNNPAVLEELGLTDEDVQYADTTQIIEDWIILNPL